MDDWIAALCAELGIEADVDVKAVLDVARGADSSQVADLVSRLAAGWTRTE